MNQLRLQGKVCSGEGNGKKYLSLPWVSQQMKQKLGYKPYLGTLNLRLTPQSARRKELLLRDNLEEICPPEGYCVGLLHEAAVNNIRCAIIIPQIKGYQQDVLEIVAEVCIRNELNLRDGDEVCVLVEV